MQIVIDIPSKWFDDMVREEFTEVDELCAVIQHGTPLPKGHGRLIDADEIQFENTEFETYGDYCIAFDAIDDAQTIIEADKAESEEQTWQTKKR